MIEAKVSSRDLERWLERRAAAVPELGVRVAERMVSLHQSQMATNVSNRSSAGLKRRSGALARSLRRTPAVGGPLGIEATSRIGRGVPYAGIHEDGGTVKPKRRRFLTVPFGAALTAAGVQRKTAKLERFGGGFRTRGRVPGSSDRRTFIYRKGRTAIIAVPGAGDSIVPLYALKRRVRIPARLGFVDTWRKQKPKRERMIRREAQRFVRGEGGR